LVHTCHTLWRHVLSLLASNTSTTFIFLEMWIWWMNDDLKITPPWRVNSIVILKITKKPYLTRFKFCYYGNHYIYCLVGFKKVKFYLVEFLFFYSYKIILKQDFFVKKFFCWFWRHFTRKISSWFIIFRYHQVVRIEICKSLFNPA